MKLQILTLFATSFGAIASASALTQDLIEFNRDIRPILSENCFFCHGPDANQRKAGLRLDIREDAIAKGAITPGAEDSLLLTRIHALDNSVMPPAQANRSLSNRDKELLRAWILEGASYQEHWAFVPPNRPEPPTNLQNDWPRNPIDQFVLHELEKRDLAPSPQAKRETLIKRLHADLIGLPPTPEEVEAFVQDDDPNAYPKLVERLLANPHYGERMALPWLDSARYADSNGFQQDGDTWQWMWRDWVVRALNQDLPFDQFTIWQLAGDLLPDATVDQKIASGFNRNHLLNGEGGAIAEEQRFVILFDRVDTTSTTWLGLTMACAQCHDHKYDPISQVDYYRFMDAFNRVPESGVPGRQSSRIRVAPPFLELPTEENKARLKELEEQIAQAVKDAAPIRESAYLGWREGLRANGSESWQRLPENLVNWLNIKELTPSQEEEKEQALRDHFEKKVLPPLKSKLPEAARSPDSLRSTLARYRGDQIPRPMIMSDAKPRQTHVLDRGQYLSPTEPVSFQTPGFLPPLPEDAAQNRLGLAQWLVAENHPLTARVQVNRMWQHFFGHGLVKTSEDLGVQSEYPLHKNLLDWLAVEFRENGWSLKSMHRLIVNSAAYRQSSRMTSWHRSEDRENRLISRATRLRMPSMILRDWALASSGLLNLDIGGAPVYPYQPSNVWESLAITKERDFTYPASSGSELFRRSLYTFWRRTVGPTNMFDASNRQACRVRRGITSTPLHALTTLNDPTWVEAARALAERALRHHSDAEAFLRFAFRRVLCRNPSPEELNHLLSIFHQQLEFYKNDISSSQTLLEVGESARDETLDPGLHAALCATCLALFNLDEALTRE